MSSTTSPSTGKVYGLQRTCQVWQVSRATAYRHRQNKEIGSSTKPGPVPTVSDEQLLLLIQSDIASSPFSGEGHRKIHARLRHRQSIKVGRQRVLHLMRKNQLLSPHRSVQGKAKVHDGRITTDRPGEMWATDAAKILTVEDGWVWFFGILEHWNAECLGWHISKKGDRFAALEALNQAVKKIYGSINSEVARGLKLRTDHGSQFISEYFTRQLRYLGIAPSLGYVKEPETNGVIERFHRTLKEQVIHGRTYQNINELTNEIHQFIEDYNDKWILEKLGYHSPREARTKWEKTSDAA